MRGRQHVPGTCTPLCPAAQKVCLALRCSTHLKWVLLVSVAQERRGRSQHRKCGKGPAEKRGTSSGVELARKPSAVTPQTAFQKLRRTSAPSRRGNRAGSRPNAPSPAHSHTQGEGRLLSLRAQHSGGVAGLATRQERQVRRGTRKGVSVPPALLLPNRARPHRRHWGCRNRYT